MRCLSTLLLALVAHLCSNLIAASKFESLEELSRIFEEGIRDKNNKFSAKNFIDELLLDVVPYLVKQKPSNYGGRFEQYRDYLMKDHSNDNIVSASVTEICKRSGYEVENHKVVADDDYITRLFRVINPRADRKKLKQPPVVLMHGALIDPTVYIWCSSIQHHPEKWPRSAEDATITSWNRSLAFVLANNGYDVWLVGTRGANAENQGRAPTHGFRNFFKDKNKKNITLAERLVQLRSSVMYWRYSFDDLIEHETPRQLDRVLEITGAKNVSVLAYSYSTMVTLPMLATRPDIAKNKIHNYINVAPLINFESSNIVAQTLCKIIPFVPIELGTMFFTRLLNTKLMHTLLPLLTWPKEIRYSMGKLAINIISGSSGKYRTLIEPSVQGHLNQATSFQQLQHACQQVNAKQYQKYDYGKLANKLIYGSFKPPARNISNIYVKDWMLIAAENDNFAGKSSVDQILEQVHPKPTEIIRVDEYNHFDLVAGVDNDIKVNLPVLEFLDRYALPPMINATVHGNARDMKP